MREKPCSTGNTKYILDENLCFITWKGPKKPNKHWFLKYPSHFEGVQIKTCAENINIGDESHDYEAPVLNQQYALEQLEWKESQLSFWKDQ